LKAANIIKYLAPFTIVVIIVIFIVNIATHGSIQHPGKSSYESKCADCHGDKGEGIKALVPPLANSDFALQHFDSIPCWLKNGMSHAIIVNGIEYDQPMYPLEMDEIQIANVMNYISQEMLESDKTVSSLQVKQRLKECK
jgi:mono/diheme cytochrome c family protein